MESFKLKYLIALFLFAAVSLGAKEIFLPTAVQLAPKAKYMNQKDVNEALSLAVNLSKDYATVSFASIDSIVIKLNPNINKININEIAGHFGVDKVIYASLNTLNNVIRAEVIIKSLTDSTYFKKAEGWSVMNYRDILDDKVIYIPSVITVFQRAFAKAIGDSSMYDSYRNDYRVFPAEPLIVCGLEYENNDSLPNWELFERAQLSSYDAVENICTVASFHPDYAVFDLASRDTLWGMVKNFEVFNFKAASILDIQAISAVGVKNFVTGYIKRIPEGAEICLRLFEIRRDQAEAMKTKTRILLKDNLEDMRYAIKYLTIELLYGDIPIETQKKIDKQTDKTQKAKAKRKAKIKK
ncbi:MAG: hypothetical protein WCR42_14690 [bacterium]